MNKLKAHELLALPTNEVQKALKEVKPSLEVDLTEEQWQRLEKKVSDRVVENFIHSMNTALATGDSVEFKNSFNVRATASTKWKNDKGQPRKKLSLTTREDMKRTLNN
jgi:nucleoid DNA-binding protein